MVVFVFILGLLAGSFLNVVIYRLHRGENYWQGFSKCLFCGHRLYFWDLVPLFSYVFLKGRCRYCRQVYSSQYFWVELATGLVFVLIFWHLMPGPELFFTSGQVWLKLLLWWILAAFLIVIFVYDLRYYLILDKVVWPAAGVALLAALLNRYELMDLGWAVLIGGGFFLLQYLLSSGRWIGGGDIRLGVLMGLILVWPDILIALFIAYVSGSLVGIFLLLAGRKAWRDRIPFGTFLSAATLVTMLYGDNLLIWYLNLFLD